MKTLGKAIAAASLAAVSVNAVAVEGLSTTIGAVTDYYFRGANLGDAGGYASIDYEVGGFFVGVWAIDDNGGANCGSETLTDSAGDTTDIELCAVGNDGLETDFYLGYGVDLDGVELGIGYTRYEYTYTSDFEHEINLGVAFAGFGLDVALGVDEDEDGLPMDDEADYTVIELSYASGPYGVKLGSYDLDSSDNGNPEVEYKWFELSYSAEVGTFDVTATAGQVFDAEASSGGVTVEASSAGNNYIVFDISKSFDL